MPVSARMATNCSASGSWLPKTAPAAAGVSGTPAGVEEPSTTPHSSTCVTTSPASTGPTRPQGNTAHWSHETGTRGDSGRGRKDHDVPFRLDALGLRHQPRRGHLVVDHLALECRHRLERALPPSLLHLGDRL